MISADGCIIRWVQTDGTRCPRSLCGWLRKQEVRVWTLESGFEPDRIMSTLTMRTLAHLSSEHVQASFWNPR
jgi:hypothetical protein